MRFRFSGHESFPCRYTWLPKAYRAIHDNPLIFSDDNTAMVRLGVGKNMVRAIRFWAQAFGIANQDPNEPGLKPTFFGSQILDENGLDPYLEDVRTLWLLHWKISSIKDDPLFAWYFLLNQWPEPSFSRSEVVRSFTLESERMERPLSDFTKTQHFEIFLHTYLPVNERKGGEVVEDTLDCPLTELRFVLPAGQKENENGKREPVYEFSNDFKHEVTGTLFAYCLFDFWRKNREQEATLSFSEISAIPGSIGQIFKFSEPDLRVRLESLEQDSDGMYNYISSAAVPRVVRHCEFDNATEQILLNRIYDLVAEMRYPQPIREEYAD